MTEDPARQIRRGFLALGTGELAARVVAFGVSVYLSRVLLAGEFGVVSFALAVLLYAQRTVAWELEQFGVHEVIENDAEARLTLTGLIVFRVTVGLLLAALAALLLPFLPQPDGLVVALYALSLVPLGANTRWALLMRHRPGAAARARVAGELLAATLVLLLVHGGPDVIRVPLAQIANEALVALLLLRALPGPRLSGDLRAAWRAARPVIRRGVPVVLYSLLGLITFNVDLMMVRFVWGRTEAGYYAAAYAVTGLLINLGIAYYANVVPAFSRVRDQPRAMAELYRGALLPVVAVAVPIAVGGVLVAPALIWTIFGEAYSPSIWPMRPLVVATSLTILRFVPLAALVVTGHRMRALWINVAGAVASIGLNLILIPRFGLVGAASSALATETLRVVMAFALATAVGVRPSSLGWVWRYAVAAAVMGVAVWPVSTWSVFISIPVGAATYAIALLATGAVKIGAGRAIEFRT
jgi:O-antigen/teichoic acid export membrane protein